MSQGELLTKLSIWLAVVAYGFGAGLQLCAHGRPRWLDGARWAWTAGCGLFLAHVFCAFGYYHHWSHAAAYRETARQTAALTGWRWGGGLYFNYVFAAAWLADVLCWWLAPASFIRHSRGLSALWRGFFFFMVFNGTLVFGHGPVRWLGVIVCGSLALLWWRRGKTIAAPPPAP